MSDPKSQSVRCPTYLLVGKHLVKTQRNREVKEMATIKTVDDEQNNVHRKFGTKTVLIQPRDQSIVNEWNNCIASPKSFTAKQVVR